MHSHLIKLVTWLWGHRVEPIHGYIVISFMNVIGRIFSYLNGNDLQMIVSVLYVRLCVLLRNKWTENKQKCRAILWFIFSVATPLREMSFMLPRSSCHRSTIGNQSKTINIQIDSIIITKFFYVAICLAEWQAKQTPDQYTQDCTVDNNTFMLWNTNSDLQQNSWNTIKRNWD